MVKLLHTTQYQQHEVLSVASDQNLDKQTCHGARTSHDVQNTICCWARKGESGPVLVLVRNDDVDANVRVTVDVHLQQRNRAEDGIVGQEHVGVGKTLKV